MKEYEIKIENNIFMKIRFSVFYDGLHRHILALYNMNGTFVPIYDPYIIALILFDNFKLDKILIKVFNKNKVVQYVKKEDIPYESIIYECSGGNKIWKDDNIKLKYDYNKLLSFWKDDIDELFEDAFTINDLIIIFKYLKYNMIIPRLGEVLDVK